MPEEFNPATTEDDLTGRFLTFYIDNAVYGIELTHVIDIISAQEVTNVPSTPAYVKGIINLRGSIVPVIDVRLKFNIPEREYDLDNQVTASLPEFNNVNTKEYLRSISKVDNHLVLNLDCEKFLEDGNGF